MSTILTIVSEYVDHSQLGNIFVKIDDTFPEMDFYNCSAYKQSFPPAKKVRGGKKALAKKALDAAAKKGQSSPDKKD